MIEGIAQENVKSKRGGGKSGGGEKIGRKKENPGIK